MSARGIKSVEVAIRFKGSRQVHRVVTPSDRLDHVNFETCREFADGKSKDGVLTKVPTGFYSATLYVRFKRGRRRGGP